MVAVLGALRRPRHPGSCITLRIWAHHRDQNVHRCTCRRPHLLYLLIPEQNQRKVYHEVLVAGDLSGEDLSQAEDLGIFSTTDPDTAELGYGNEAVHTVYFAQPSLSQFVPGGFGAGAFNPPAPMGLKDPSNNTFVLTDRNTEKNDTGTVLRYALPVC